MFVLQVLNSNNEWELCRFVFNNELAAVDFYNENLAVFDDYLVTEMEAAQ